MMRQTVCRCVLAGVVGGACALADGQSQTLRFRADYASRTMKVPTWHTPAAFTRDITTIDPDGATVNPNVPRFDDSVMIAAVPGPASTGGFERVYNPGGYLLASGVDHNGSTPLMVFLNVSNGKLLVFHADTISPQPGFETFATGEVFDKVLAVRVAAGESHLAGNGRTFYDLLDNTPTAGAKALQPKTAVICHGAILVGGPVWVHTGGGVDRYELKGWGFAINQDHGATTGWTLVWDDTNQPQGQLYVPRGLYWCMRAAPIWQRGASYPTSFAICCSDYVFKNDNPQTPQYQAASGRAFYFRITRPASPPSQLWTVGAGTQPGNEVKVFDIRPPAYRLLSHVHACIATEWTPPPTQLETPGVQLVVSIGDGPEVNRFIRFTMANHTTNYTATPDPWAIQENYHGRGNTSDGVEEATQSMQPGTGLFAPTAGDIIWATDLQAEWLSLMRLPNGGASPDQARFLHLYGWATGFGHDASNPLVPRPRPVFQGLSQPRPEVIGHQLAVVYQEDEILAGATPDARRILFCPDSTNLRDWVQVAATHNIGSSPTVAIHESPVQGNYLYFASFAGINRMLIPSAAVDPPTLLSLRPILVAPGGKNLLHASYLIDPEHAPTFNELLKQPALNPPWQDNGRGLPSPPSMASRATRMRTTLLDGSSWAGSVRLSSSLGGTTWHNLPSGSTWVEGTQVRRLRGWVLDNSYDRAALTPTLIPNKTDQTHVRLWDETTPGGGNAINYSCDDRWCPLTIIGRRLIGTNLGLGLRINGDGRGNDILVDENYGFFLPDLALDGNGSLPYPMLPNAAGPDAPDEKLTIASLTLTTEQSWSLRVAGMMPIANWDHHAARETFNGSGVSSRRWPLCTLWADDNNWIEFSANCEDNKGFRVRVKADGTLLDSIEFGDGKQIWLPDSPLLLAIGHVHSSGPPVTRKLYVGASLGGDMVKLGPDGITVLWTGRTFTEFRFRGAAPGGVSNDGEVCEFRWIGGEINPTSALTNTTLPSAFVDLDFLSGP